MKRNLILATAWFILAFCIIIFFINQLRNDNTAKHTIFNVLPLKYMNKKYNSKQHLLREDIFEADKINSIRAAIVNEDINFFPSTNNQFLVKISGSNNGRKLPEIKLEDTCLSITADKSIGKKFIFRRRGSFKIEIFVPLQKNEIEHTLANDTNRNAIEVFIESASSNIKAENVNLKNLILKNVSGDLFLKNAKIENVLEYNTVSGNINGEAHINSFIVKSTSGDFKLKFLSEPKHNSEFKTVSGDFYIRLPENINGFSCKFHSISGDYKNDFIKTSAKKNKEETYKTESPRLFIKTVSGNCKIMKM